MRLGIDFGTCFSSAAFMEGENMRLVTDTTNSEASVPSSVFLTPPEKFSVGKVADNRQRQDPERYRHELKRDLGREEPLLLGFRAVDLIAQVLGKIKHDADAWAISKGKRSFTGAVIGIPTTYQENKRALMHQAASKAGFVPEEITLVAEPNAAALYYIHEHAAHEGERLLIYDLGGGTFDTAFIQKKGNDFTDLALPAGIERCGGIDFDRAIYEDILKQFPVLQNLLRPNRTDKDALLARRILGELCISVKHQLTQADEVEEPIVLPNLEKVLHYRLTQTQFNQMIEPYLRETLACCQKMLQQENFTWDQVDRIILVGGSCNIPYVKKLLEKETGRPVSKVLQLGLVVCQGAARYAALHNVYVVSATPGEADFTSIAAALKQARESSQIVVHPGIYKEQLVIDREVEIIGAGPRDQIVLETEAGAAIRMAAKQAKIQGLTLHHRAPSALNWHAYGGVVIPQGHLELVDCVLEAKVQTVSIWGANSQGSLRGCQIRGGSVAGIALNNGGQASLEQCDIAESLHTGIQVCHKGSKITLNNCLVHHGKGVGLSIALGAQATLENCQVFSNTLSGIQILGEHSSATLTQCRIYEGEEVGITVWRKGQLTAQKCDICGNLHTGIFLSDKGSAATLTDCHIRDGKYAGIEIVKQSLSTLEGCRLYNNSGPALRISGEGSLARASKSTIEQNKYAGILLQERSQGEFNTVSLMKNNGPGIRISHLGSKATLEACAIEGNGVGVLVEQQGESTTYNCQIEKNRVNIYIEPGSKLQTLYLDKETEQLVARGGSNSHHLEIWQQTPRPTDVKSY